MKKPPIILALLVVCALYGASANAAQQTAQEQATSGTSPLSLHDCIETALANNPDIAAGIWTEKAAAAGRNEAEAQRWPWVHARGAYTHSVDNNLLKPLSRPAEPSVFTDDVVAGDLVLAFPIFTGGRITNRIAAADLLEKAARHQLARTRDELVFNVSSLFYAILSQRRVIDSVEFSRQALKEHRDRVSRMVNVQKAAKVDLLRTEVKLADVEQRLVYEKNRLEIERQTMATLLGTDIKRSAVRLTGSLDVVDVNTDTQKDMQNALKSRPDYQAAQSALDAVAKNLAAAKGEYWPTVSLEGSYGGRWAPDPDIRQSGADEFEDVGQLGVVMSVPLFEAGAIKAKVQRQEAQLQVAKANLHKLELRIRLEVESAELNIGSARERVRATEKSIAQAKESFRIEQEKYNLGRGSITNVLDAQAALLDAETNYYQALSDYNTSVAQLRLATGEE